jgi:Cu-Zn family superoxide dismutase
MVNSVLVPAAAALLGALAIGGCAAQNHGTSGSSGAAAATATAPVGVFAPVRHAPPTSADVSGNAELTADPDGGSDVSISLRGLRPNLTHIAHVHQGSCDQPDPGGPHFKFDPGGPATAPNEIHLRFAANATGGASAQAHSKRAVPKGAAGSIVVHEDAPAQAAGAATGKPKAPAGHEHHAGASPGGATASEAKEHSHAAKIACAALRESDHTDVPSGTPPPGMSGAARSGV